MKWWQQQMALNQWAYDTAQPPLVYNAKVGGKKTRVVSVATMEGRLVRLRRSDRAADLPAREGDRPHRASAAAAGQAGHGLPVLARRPELLAGVVRPEHELHLQRRGGDRRGRCSRRELTPTQKKQQVRCSATSSSGSQNGNFGTLLPGLARPRLDQRDRRRTPASGSGSSRRRSRSAAASRPPRAASASPAAATASCARST